MNANRLILVASALALVACSDNYRSTLTEPAGVNPPAPVLQKIRGTVVLDNGFGAPSLQTETARISLQGSVASTMASVDGTDVEVLGIFDGASALMVESFEVVGFQGRPALDGYLDIDDQGRLWILRANNELVPVDNPSEELRAYIGQRIWLVQGDSDDTTEFGAIVTPDASI